MTKKRRQILQLFFSYPCGSRWFIFTKHIIIVLLSECFQLFDLSSPKQLLLKFLQNPHEDTCVKVYRAYVLNNRLWHRSSLVNLGKLSRTPILQNTLGLLLLHLWNKSAIWCNLMLISQSGFSKLLRYS